VLSAVRKYAFADFPSFCRAIAQNNYLPLRFWFSRAPGFTTIGFWFFAILTGALLILFGGITDRLTSALRRWPRFSPSRSPVRHGCALGRKMRRPPHWLKSAMVNGPRER